MAKRFVREHGTGRKVPVDLNPQFKAVLGVNVFLQDGVTLLDLAQFVNTVAVTGTAETIPGATASTQGTQAKVLGRLPDNSLNPTNINFALPVLFKGDLLGYSSYPTRVPIGADNTVLIADHTQTLGLRWGTPAGGNLIGAPIWTAFNSGTFNGTSVNYVGTSLFVLLPATEIINSAATWTIDLQLLNSLGGAGTASINLALYRCARGTRLINDVLTAQIGGTSNPTITFASGVWNGTLDTIATPIDPTYDHYFVVYGVSVSVGTLDVPTQNTGRWASSNGIPNAGGTYVGFAYSSAWALTDYTTLVAGNSIPGSLNNPGGAAAFSFARVVS